MSKLSDIIALVEGYIPKSDLALIKKAYLFAKKAHEGQKRKSGEPYFIHLEEVTIILAKLRADVHTIITGLLHDTLEDTTTTPKKIEKEFGKEVLSMVDGVTKLNGVMFHSKQVQYTENFRKFLISASVDIRVLLVKLADRLHNMRTIGFQPPEKRNRISLETLDVFAPLADRFGINTIKDELESLAFAQINPEQEKAIRIKLDELSVKNNKLLNSIIKELLSDLSSSFFKVDIVGRIKSPYSIWTKMKKRNINLLQMSDIIALRVLVNSIEDCYFALGIIHTKYKAVGGKFKDYISVPKSNNYQSIHTIIVGPFKQHVEIQIRTREMHEFAESGVAAHWGYKKGIKDFDKLNNYRWVRSFLQLMQQKSSADDLMDNTKIDMFQGEVFCFTPKGDVISLPSCATVLDFAYAVHSSVGNSCVSARVNGNTASIYKVLRLGDNVEVITSPFQTPSVSWKSKVVTSKAKLCIKRFLKSQKYAEYMAIGITIVKQVFAENKQDFSDEAVHKTLVTASRCESCEDFYIKVGQCLITSTKIKQLLAQNKHDQESSTNSNITEKNTSEDTVFQTLRILAIDYRNMLMNVTSAFYKYDIEIINISTKRDEVNRILIFVGINNVIDSQQFSEIVSEISQISGVIDIKDVI